MNTAEPPVRPGEILAGKYRVERVLGVGGMGVVVAATHMELLEARAIKFMLPEGLSDADSVERFEREARAASRLKSEHVAHVHDIGRLENGAPYMVMEYLEGCDLSATLKRDGPLPFGDAVFFVLQAAEALAEAHGRGIVHRDLKPANLFVSLRPDGTPCIKVLDFGISKVTGATWGDDDLTRTNATLGSPHYMSPEQMRCTRDADSRSDIWSLGVILYQLITGHVPYRGHSIAEIVANVLQVRPHLPSQVVPGVPKAIDAVILRCLEHDRDQRYANVGELAQALLPFAPPIATHLVDAILRLVAAPSRSATGLPLVLPDSKRLRAIPPAADSIPTASVHDGGSPGPVQAGAEARPGPASAPLPPPAPPSIPVSPTSAWGRTARGGSPRRSLALLALGFGAAMLLGALLMWSMVGGAPRPAPAASGFVAGPKETAAPPEDTPPRATATAAAATASARAAPSSAASAASASASAGKAPVRSSDPFGMDRK